MPTRIGSIWAQYNGWHWTNGDHILTIRPNNRDITADSAISAYGTTRNDHWGETGIWQIVTNGTRHEFNDRYRPRAQNDNVTEIRFRTRTSDCTVFARHKIDFWS